MEGSGADVEESELGAVVAAAVQGELRAGRSTRCSSGSAGRKAMAAAIGAETQGEGGGGTG
nr:unnamed protein product [Digitaria exilis]